MFRPFLLIGLIIQMSALLAMGGMGTVAQPSYSLKSGIVAVFVIFSFGFSISWAPLTYVVTTEVADVHLRDHSQRFASVINVITK